MRHCTVHDALHHVCARHKAGVCVEDADVARAAVDVFDLAAQRVFLAVLHQANVVSGTVLPRDIDGLYRHVRRERVERQFSVVYIRRGQIAQFHKLIREDTPDKRPFRNACSVHQGSGRYHVISPSTRDIGRTGLSRPPAYDVGGRALRRIDAEGAPRVAVCRNGQRIGPRLPSGFGVEVEPVIYRA